MRRSVVLGLILLAATPKVGFSQVEVRKSFAAASQQNKPATFTWVSESSPTDIAFASIDAAIRYAVDTAISLGTVIGGPVFEWHRLTKEDGETDRVSIGTAGELAVTPVRLGWLGSPFLVASGSYEIDRVGDADGLTAATALTFYSSADWAPGSQTRLFANGMFRYYPWVGVERRAQVSDSISGVSFAFAKVTGELWPHIGRMQILASYLMRGELGDAQLKGGLDQLSISANLYFADERVGFGMEFENGENPSEGFAIVDRLTVGFKVKF